MTVDVPRRRLFRLGGAAAAAPLPLTPLAAAAQTLPELRWRLASSFPPSLDPI